MNRTNFQAITVAAILGAATMIFAQSAAPSPAKTDSIVEINMRNLAELEVITDMNDKAINYKMDLLWFWVPGNMTGNVSTKNGFSLTEVK